MGVEVVGGGEEDTAGDVDSSDEIRGVEGTASRIEVRAMLLVMLT